MLRIFADKDKCNCGGVKGVENIAARDELSRGPCTPPIAGFAGLLVQPLWSRSQDYYHYLIFHHQYYRYKYYYKY